MSSRTATATDPPRRIFLWCNPRSLSTVFLKCVSCMDGADVWHEPYVYSLENYIVSRPDLLQRYSQMKFTRRSQDEASVNDEGTLQPASIFRYDWVKEQLEKPLKPGKTFLFVKDAPLAIDGHFDKLPQVPFKHTFIIRNPLRSAPSFRNLCVKIFDYQGDVDQFDMNSCNPYVSIDTAVPDRLYAFWLYVKDNIEPHPVVIDADDLQIHPEQTLRNYCEAVGIPFKMSYLTWDESKEPLKRINAPKHLISEEADAYVGALSSSSFMPISSSPPNFEDLTPDAQKYCSCLLEGYNEMYQSRIKPII
ncbi:hypothetical protein HOLleu_27112 [Holothuria leucospilota]|uniref:Sulfotransferase family protein n=1 Tax=Holothuria leucospilota TaxID=206669 RepID=A0A9Q1H231_HOLLE|nr:hypothetical protein HOLleu_27112 [Holothuria leucospilota]